MKVALIADAHWLEQERLMFERLIVGLVDESVKVVRIEPEVGEEKPQKTLMTTERLGYKPTRWDWLRDRQVWAMRDGLREMGVDVIHALDGSLQSVAVELGEELDVPVLCSVWSEGEANGLAKQEGGPTTTYTAASRGLAAAIRKSVGETPVVECVPPGVYAVAGGAVEPPLRHAGESLCCIVVGNGKFDGHYRAMLEGMARAKPRLEGAMYFFHTVEADQHGLWQAAETLGLLDEVSLVPSGTDARQLLVQADAILQPQPLGAVRSVVLEAMAAQRPVVAAEDPLADHLLEGTTVRLMRHATADDWAACLESMVSGPGSFVELGRSAGLHVAEHHKASAFVERLKQLYEKLAEPEAMPFTP